MQNKQDWEELGRNIQDIVDRAVKSQDYQKLNQTIRQTVSKAVAGADAVRKASASRPAKVVTAEPVVVKKELPVLYAKTNGKTAVGVLQIVGGGVLAGVTLALWLASSILGMIFGFTAAPGTGTWLCLAGGGAFIWRGIANLTRLKRFKTYRKTLGDKTQCAIEKLARSVGKSVKFVRRELLSMIQKGLFLEGHLDKEQTMLITSDETYQLFEQSRLLLEQRQAQAKEEPAPTGRSPEIQEVLDRGNAFIREIRRCNDAIPGEGISAKIDRMETIVRKIFQRVESHPEIVPDLKKMMDYYLPMTVKLLGAYADMDAQLIQGPNIEASKREIEDTLDTLNLAFEKLLDDLFADTALDVSSDISVLQTLLAQEGLTDDGLGRLRKGE